MAAATRACAIDAADDDRVACSSSTADGRAAAPRRSTGTAARRSASSGSAPATAPQLDQARPRRSSSAPTAATPAPTARRRCSPRAAFPQGDCAPVPWLLSSRGYAVLGRHRRQRHPVRAQRASGSRVSTRAAAGPLRLRCSAQPTPAARLRALLPADRLPGAAARVGLRLLEEPRRPRAPGRRARRLRRLPPPRHPARRDRDRLAVGDAIQHLGVQPAPVPGRAGDDRERCAPTGCAPSCGSRRGSTSTRATGRSRRSPSQSACTASRPPTTRRPRPRATSSASRRASRS